MTPRIALRQNATDPVASRRDLAARPVAEKLRMLDALRERELAIRGRVVHPEAGVLREAPGAYGETKK